MLSSTNNLCILFAALSMSHKNKFCDSNQMYFISFATLHWIDVVSRNEYKDELVKSFKYCQQKKGLKYFLYWCRYATVIKLLRWSRNEASVL